LASLQRPPNHLVYFQGDHRKILERLFHQFSLLLVFFLANLWVRISSQARVGYLILSLELDGQTKHQEWAEAIEVCTRLPNLYHPLSQPSLLGSPSATDGSEMATNMLDIVDETGGSSRREPPNHPAALRVL